MKRINTMRWIIFYLILFALTPGFLIGDPIKNYQFFSGECGDETGGSKRIAIRRFQSDDEAQYLLIDTENLSTAISAENRAHCSPLAWDVLRKKYLTTTYFRGLEEASTHSDALQDAGITHFLPTQRGVDLTIDLCPSRLPLDRIVFTDLLNELGKEEHPVPLAIAITGIWIKEHPDDLAWLRDLANRQKIAVDWINHTYHHRTSKNLPLRQNFLLEKGTDVSFEILQTEILMIQQGLIPSVFFRFPGLVSDPSVFEKIERFGLIPVGSDAWLAKGEWPKGGSIVLIHANGNEEIGVRDFIHLLQSERKNVLSKRWLLYDLRESLVEEEETHE